MSQPISIENVIESLADFDKHGGASVGLVAWDLCLEPEHLTDVLQQAACDGLIQPAGHDHQQRLYRLTPAGWTAYDGELEAA
jgi:hypothetical protein